MSIAPAEPRVSASSINMGSSVTITHESPSYIGIKRYTITWSFAGQTGTLATQTSNTTTTWQPATATFAAYIPNAVSGVATISCATYDLSTSSTTPVGTKTCTVTLMVPSSVKPTVSSATLGEGNASLPSAFSGVYVKGYSKFKLSFTAAGANGSTIKRVSFNAEGKTYSGNYSASSVTNSLTSDTLTQAGTGRSVSYTVTDSRGREASGTIGSITVKDYSVPQITSLRARRSNGNTASSSGTNAQRYVTASVTAVGTNAITSAVLWWKQKSAGTYANSDKITIASSGTAIPSSGSAAWTVIAQSGANVTFNGLYSYDFKLELTDTAGNTTTAYTSISTTSVVLDFKSDGTGLGIGKLSETSNAIDSAWTYRGTSMYLTGGFHVQNNCYMVADRNDYSAAATPSSNIWGTIVAGRNETDSYDRAYMRQIALTDGTQGVQVETRRDISGTTYYNGLRLMLDASGNQSVTINNAAAWRTALALGTMATQSANNYLPLSGGTLTGALTLASAGLKTSNTAGYTLNQYGNFVHSRATTGDTWNITNNAGTGKFAVNYESGATTIASSLTINNSSRINFTAPDSNAFTPVSINKSDGSTRRAWAELRNSNRWMFGVYTPSTSIYERFDLPDPTATDANKYYYIATTKTFQYGGVGTATVNANSYKSGTVTFGTPYANPPVVVVSLYGGADNQSKFGNVSVRVIAYGSAVSPGGVAQTTSFTYEIDNADSSSVNVGVNWMAYANA